MSKEILKNRATTEDGIFTNYTMYKVIDWLAFNGSIRKYRELTDYNFETLEPIFKTIYEFNGIKFELCDSHINALGETIIEVASTQTGEIKEILIDEYKHFYVKVDNIVEEFIQEVEPIIEID